MDRQNKEEGSAPGWSLPGPPTLNQSMLDFGCVPLGSQKTLEQIIANTTRRPMIWLADAHESQWLTLEPDHGVLQPGEQQSIRVTADTSSLEIGAHSVTLTFSSEGDETSMSEYTTGKINVEESALQPFQAGLDFGFLPPDSTSQLGLLITNPNNRPLDWYILIGTLVKEPLEHPDMPSSKEDHPLMEDQGISLSQTEGQYPPSHEGRWNLENQGISFSQTEGQLAALGSQTVYVTVDSTNRDTGYSYKGNLVLGSKTAQSIVLVPVTFYVNGTPGNDNGPRAPHNLQQNINFAIPSGQAGTHTLSFTNIESEAVNWVLTTGATWLTPRQANGTMAPHGSDQVDLTATKVGAGNYKTGLNLTLTWHNPRKTGETEIKPWIHVFLTVQ